MNVGDKVYIRNNCGKLTVELVKKLSLRDVFTGMGDDKLPAIKQPRWEFHSGPYGKQLITLCGGEDNLPATMYVAFWGGYEEPEIWMGRYDNGEEAEDIYETVRYD